MELSLFDSETTTSDVVVDFAACNFLLSEDEPLYEFCVSAGVCGQCANATTLHLVWTNTSADVNNYWFVEGYDLGKPKLESSTHVLMLENGDRFGHIYKRDQWWIECKQD